MTTVTHSNDDLQVKEDPLQSDIFSLIWLDSNVNSHGIRNTGQRLRTVINRLKTFQDATECENYIEDQPSTTRLVIIVSGQLGQILVPSVHQLRQIKCVTDNLDELISEIKANHKIEKKIGEPFSINSFTTSSDQGPSTTDLNGKFIFSQILIDCLLRLKPTEVDKTELLSSIRLQYAGNQIELSNISEFEKSYSSNKILSWYTKESFFYNSLNSALRHRRTHQVFLFRGYIADMCQELKKYQVKHPIKVFRCQLMSNDELKSLQKLVGHFISINSFFSTSIQKQQALSFLNTNNTNNNLESILFEIDADPAIVSSKPFGDITKYSEFPCEEEIIFMLGSIFRLNDISRESSDHFWTVYMTLYGENDHKLESVSLHIKQQYLNGEVNLRTLGKLLWTMGKLDLAEKYYIRFVEELPPNHLLLPDVYKDLGDLASQERDYEKSLEWHQKAVQCKHGSSAKGSASTPKHHHVNTVPNIAKDAKWIQNGITIAGNHGKGFAPNQLHFPWSICVTQSSIIIADSWNHRIVQWKKGESSGRIVAGGNGPGNRLDQLRFPTCIVLDKETDSFIICDRENRRVVQWSRQAGTTQGKVLFNNIYCCALVIDDKKNFYISDSEEHVVRRYQVGDTNGAIVAGGHGEGDNLNQLKTPTHLFVDQQNSIYISDSGNHRVMKWKKHASEGIIVAGGQGEGQSVRHLWCPNGLFVDTTGTVYVADSGNNRVMRWPKRGTQGTPIIGGYGEGATPNRLYWPIGLTVDHYGNLYIVDWGNHRIQKFLIET